MGGKRRSSTSTSMLLLVVCSVGMVSVVVATATSNSMETPPHQQQQQQLLRQEEVAPANPTAAIVGIVPVDVVAKEQTPPFQEEVKEGDFTANAAAFARHEALGMALAGLAIFIAAGGGTGGGGVLDPIYILIMKLDAKTAIPLSSITIVGGAIANLLINIRRTRRNSTQPLIDWDFILVMQPMLLSKHSPYLLFLLHDSRNETNPLYFA